jgi:uncharacterized protein YkwD
LARARRRRPARRRKGGGLARILVVAVCLAAVFAWLGRDGRLREMLPKSWQPYADLDGIRSRRSPARREVRLLAPESREPPPRGSAMEIALGEPPATHYASGDDDPGAGHEMYAELLSKLSRDDVAYDRNLGRAARELAYQYSVLGAFPPSEGIDFIVRSAGSVDRGVSSRIVRTGSGEQSVLADAMERVLEAHTPGRDILRLGLGEVWAPGAERPRLVAVMVSRRALDVDTTPRSADLEATWTLSGVAPAGLRKLSARALLPDGKLIELDTAREGQRFRVDVPMGDTPGTVEVELSGDGRRGPGKLLQVPVYVGMPLPETLVVRIPPDESDLESSNAAEARALSLLNDDRERYRVGSLSLDERLSAVARAHSMDMRDNRFFGHLSPTTGLLRDRVAAAGYRAVSFAENVAHNSTVYDAQDSLLRSLGHRINIVNPSFTRVGIGVAADRRGGEPRWYLTQVFARPVVRVDAIEDAEALHARIARERSRVGHATLRRSGTLDRVARDVATHASMGQLTGLADLALDKARAQGSLRGRGWVWLAAVAELDAIEVPKAALQGSARRIGVGLHQSATDPAGRVGIVLIVAE